MRAFVSYSSPDEATASDLVDHLAGQLPGFESYLAPRSNIGGTYWLPQLSVELARTDAVLLLLGNSVGPWQELEYFEALRLNRDKGRPRIVPVVLGPEAPGLPFLDQFHTLRLHETGDAGIADALIADRDVAAAGELPAWRRTNPYRGLQVYTSRDAAYFFGRDDLIGELLEALSARRPELLMLVGNSGVGKSSLVLAGLFSALRSQIWPGVADRPWPMALADSTRWQTVTCRPDTRPAKSLAIGFTSLWLEDPAEADAQANKWVQNFAGGSTLVDLTRQAQKKLAALSGDAAPSRFLIYVDQGEELYARAEAEQARHFVALLAEAVGAPEISLLASLRADYYGQLQADKALFAVSRRLDIPPFDVDALAAVITEPAKRLGARIEPPEMVSLVAKAAEDEPGALPLLSFLLTETWDRMRATPAADGVFRLSRDVLDLSRPLIDRAEAFLSAHADSAGTLKRLISRRLVHVPKEGEIVRRLAFRPDCAEDEWTVAVALAAPEWRLLTLGEEAGIPVVDVAHETLLRAWPRAARWIEAEREFLIWRGQFESARQTWEAALPEQRDAAVLMGLALATAADWMATRADALTAADRDFIETSSALDRARRDDEAAKARALAEERERSRRRATWISRLASATALIFLGLGAWALSERDRARGAQEFAEANERTADRERRIAEASVARFFATEAVRLDPSEYGARAVLLGIEAARLDLTSETDAALRATLSRYLWEPASGHEGVVTGLAISDDGTRMASTGADGTVRLWDLDDPARGHHILYRAERKGKSVAIGAGRLAAAIDGRVLIWSLDDPDAAPDEIAIEPGDGAVLALSPDGTRLFFAGASERGSLWDLSGPEQAPVTLAIDAGIRAATFSRDSQTLALAGESRVAMFPVAAPNSPPTILTADQQEVYDIAFSGDGTTLGTVGWEPRGFNYASVWKLEDLDAGSTTVKANIGPMELAYTASSIIVDQSGNRLIVGNNDGEIRVWYPAEPTKNYVLFTAPGAIEAIAFASHTWIAVADAFGMIYLYDMRGSGREPQSFAPGTSVPTTIDVSPDGKVLLTGTSGGDVLKHDLLHPKREPEVLFSGEGEIRSVAHDPTGQWMAVGTSEGRILIFDRTDPAADSVSPDGIDGLVLPLVFDPSGKRLIASDDKGLLLIDTGGGPEQRLDPGKDRVVGARTLPDGSIQAVTHGGDFLVWAEGMTEAPSRTALGGPVQNAAFGPGGRWLALTRGNNALTVHDLAALDLTPISLDTEFRGSTFSMFGYPVAFNSDGDWLAFAGGGGNIWLWQSRDWSLPPIALSAGRGMMEVDLSFVDGGDYLVSGGGFDGPPRLWAMPDTLLDRACARAGRNLTLEEWRLYWGVRNYRRTCVEWPLPDDLISAAAATLVEDGDAESVLARLRGIWSDGAQQPAGPDVDAGHRSRIVARLLRRAVSTIDSSRGPPDLPKVRAYLEAVSAIAPDYNMANAPLGPGSWNRLCWNGALWGMAEELLYACDLAVAGASGEALAMNRDSRGVARARTGNSEGAIADFEAFVAYFETAPKQLHHVESRKEWIAALHRGENPFDEDMLNLLRSN